MVDKTTFFRIADEFLFIADNYNMSKLLCCMRLFY